jgi:mRNA-degrading endonuclease toxin of MazEF toxin-antitoxin module
MIKDYLLSLLDWWKTSVLIGNRKTAPSFKEGEIWWCSLGINIGVEIFGKGKDFSRPVVIFKKIGNNSFLGIPLTTQMKNGNWYVRVFYGGVEQRAILSQIRIFDERRLIKRLGTLSYRNRAFIKERFLEFYCS